MDNTGASEQYEEDRATPCAFCGHGAPSHAVDDEERRECTRRMCECPQYEVCDVPCAACDHSPAPESRVDGMRLNCGDCGRTSVWNDGDARWERWNEPTNEHAPHPEIGKGGRGRPAQAVRFAPHVERGVAGAKAIAATYDDTLAAIYTEAASRDRRCPECGSREINATEAVCLACSNRAWRDTGWGDR